MTYWLQTQTWRTIVWCENARHLIQAVMHPPERERWFRLGPA